VDMGPNFELDNELELLTTRLATVWGIFIDFNVNEVIGDGKWTRAS
jgi:hypothetical protein